jgi:DNA-binding CsgD family transcriptional regulator
LFVITYPAARRPTLPQAISEPLSDLAYQLTVTYGMRLRLVTPHGREVPIHATPQSSRSALADELTAAEHRIARLLTSGATNDEIAGWLSISTKTVEAHLTHIYRKLGIRTRAHLAYLIGQEENH